MWLDVFAGRVSRRTIKAEIRLASLPSIAGIGGVDEMRITEPDIEKVIGVSSIDGRRPAAN